MDRRTDGWGALQYLSSRAFGAAGDNKLNSDSGLILHYDMNEQAEQWQWFGDSTLWHERTSWTVTVVWGFYIMTRTNKLNSDSGLGILHYDINEQAEQWQWFGDSTLWHQRTSWTVTVVWFYIMTWTNKLNSDSGLGILHYDMNEQAEQWQWFGDSTLWHQRTSWTVTVVWFYIMTSTNKLNSDSEMAKVILHKEINKRPMGLDRSTEFLFSL